MRGLSEQPIGYLYECVGLGLQIPAKALLDLGCVLGQPVTVIDRRQRRRLEM